MTTYRWYVLGLVTPRAEGADIPAEGLEYEITGWSRTKGAADERVKVLDKQGRLGIKVMSANRQQAARDALACFNHVAKVRGYISPEDKRIGRAIVKGAVMRAIFCPYTGQVLDMRRAVVVELTKRTTQTHVMTAADWDTLKGELLPAAEKAGMAVKVYDGRELFKR